MVRWILSFLFSILFLCADSIDDVIINFIGEQSYQINQNFVNRLFSDRKNFFLDQEEQRIDYHKIAKTLKDNGLLYLKFKEPMEVNLAFKAETKPIFLMQTINSVLSSMGYSYFAVTKAQYAQENALLTFSLNTEHGVAPEVVLYELKKRGILASQVARENEVDWFYELEIIDPSIAGAMILNNDDRLELKNVSGEYWFRVKNSGVISIVKKNSKIGWSPRIVLYDKNLQILEILTQKEFTASVEVNVTQDTAFVMVTDFNNPSRLQNGITITFSSFDQIRDE